MSKQQPKEYTVLLKERKNIENQLKNNDYSKNIDSYFSLLKRLSIIKNDINIIKKEEKINNDIFNIVKYSNTVNKAEPFLEAL
jgi:hypothetical protein